MKLQVWRERAATMVSQLASIGWQIDMPKSGDGFSLCALNFLGFHLGQIVWELILVDAWNAAVFTQKNVDSGGHKFQARQALPAGVIRSMRQPDADLLACLQPHAFPMEKATAAAAAAATRMALPSRPRTACVLCGQVARRDVPVGQAPLWPGR